MMLSETFKDFIGYKNNTFYFLDAPGGGDVNAPNIVFGGKVGIGANPQYNELEVLFLSHRIKLVMVLTGKSV